MFNFDLELNLSKRLVKIMKPYKYTTNPLPNWIKQRVIETYNPITNEYLHYLNK